MKILILDDDSLVADLISDYLKNDDRVSEIHCMPFPENVIEFISRNSIDLVFLDLYMPNFIGFEVLKEIREKLDKVKVVILSSHFQAKYINKALQMNVSGYLSKSINKNEIYNALNSIYESKIYLCKECYKELDMSKMKENNPKFNINTLITDREIDVLKLIIDGLSSQEIANKLFISKDTVETHKKHLYEKTGVKKITQLVKVAIENQLI